MDNRLIDELQNIKILLAQIETDLRHHIRRTELLEDEVKEWRQDFKPVQNHVAFVSQLGRLLLIIAAVAGAIAAVYTVK